MTEHKDGGPAFPSIEKQTFIDGHSLSIDYQQGMTLWDYFAAHALSGLLAQGEMRAEKGSPAIADWYARVAGDLSDCLLAEREKRFK